MRPGIKPRKQPVPNRCARRKSLQRPKYKYYIGGMELKGVTCRGIPDIEIGFSIKPRSASWLKARHNNISNPQTFYSVEYPTA